MKNCVNPFHLEEVTIGENTSRAVRNKYGTHTHCTRGHLLSVGTVGYTKNKSGFQRYCKKCNVINVRIWRKKQFDNKLVRVLK